MRNKLLYYRLLNKVSITKMEKDLSIAKSHISNMQNCKNNPSLENAYAIANYFGVCITEIFPNKGRLSLSSIEIKNLYRILNIPINYTNINPKYSVNYSDFIKAFAGHKVRSSND